MDVSLIEIKEKNMVISIGVFHLSPTNFPTLFTSYKHLKDLGIYLGFVFEASFKLLRKPLDMCRAQGYEV